MIEKEKYTKVCVVRRCGLIDSRNELYSSEFVYGFYDKAWNEENQEYDEYFVDRFTVLDYIWDTISKDKCAQYVDRKCLSCRICGKYREYCYPIVKTDREINDTVLRLLIYYLTDHYNHDYKNYYIRGKMICLIQNMTGSRFDTDSLRLRFSLELERLVKYYGTKIKKIVE